MTILDGWLSEPTIKKYVDMSTLGGFLYFLTVNFFSAKFDLKILNVYNICYYEDNNIKQNNRVFIPLILLPGTFSCMWALFMDIRCFATLKKYQNEHNRKIARDIPFTSTIVSSLLPSSIGVLGILLKGDKYIIGQ